MSYLTIARRINGGWTNYLPQKNDTHCDWCKNRLYVAPDGKTLYCNHLHEDVHIITVRTKSNGGIIG